MRQKSQDQQGQVTITFLLSAIELIMPTAFAVQAVKAAGGGVPRYVAAAALGLLLGGLIVVVEWRSTRFLWRRSQTFSERARNIVAMGLVALQLVWIILAAITGYQLAQLVTEFVV